MVSPMVLVALHPARSGWLRGFWAYYRRYTDTTAHTATTAALAMFGLLVFVDPWFAAVAIASYVIPPVVLYTLSDESVSDEGEGDTLEESSAHADRPVEPATTKSATGGSSGTTVSSPNTDRPTGDGDTDSDSDDGDTDSDGVGTDTDSDSDGTDTDADSDGTDTDSDSDGTDTDSDSDGTDTDSDSDGTDTDSDSDGTDTDFDRDDGDTDSDGDDGDTDSDSDG